jgi:hypothetical protein
VPSSRDDGSSVSTSRRARGDVLDALACAVAHAAVLVVFAYALLRVAERWFFRQPNPAIVLWAERSAFGWRVTLALYVGLLGAPLGFSLARHDRGAAITWLARAAALSAVTLTLQVALAP